MNYKKIEVSAPGKLMLFGEHAVIYNRPCLVSSVNQRMRLFLEVISEPEFQITAPDVGILNYKKPLYKIGKGRVLKNVKFVEIAVKNFLDFIAGKKITPNPHFISRGVQIFPFGKKKLKGIPGMKITTKSEFSSQFGFGSSSASTVCAIKALSELFNLKLTPKEIFDLSYKTVLDVQGVGSGFDIAAAVYGGTLYFITGGKTIKPLAANHLPLIVAYSGVKADTATIINQVKERTKKYPDIIEGIYSGIEKLVYLAKENLVKKDWKTLGEVMNINQGYLDALGVSNKKLSNIIYSARTAGAYGAKISGAGGGDCVIALAPEKKRKTVENAIKQAGGVVIKVKTNAKGVN